MNALGTKGEGEFGSAKLMIYEGTPFWNGRGGGGKEGRSLWDSTHNP